MHNKRVVGTDTTSDHEVARRHWLDEEAQRTTEFNKKLPLFTQHIKQYIKSTNFTERMNRKPLHFVYVYRLINIIVEEANLFGFRQSASYSHNERRCLLDLMNAIFELLWDETKDHPHIRTYSRSEFVNVFCSLWIKEIPIEIELKEIDVRVRATIRAPDYFQEDSPSLLLSAERAPNDRSIQPRPTNTLSSPSAFVFVPPAGVSQPNSFRRAGLSDTPNQLSSNERVQSNHDRICPSDFVFVPRAGVSQNSFWKARLSDTPNQFSSDERAQSGHVPVFPSGFVLAPPAGVSQQNPFRTARLSGTSPALFRAPRPISQPRERDEQKALWQQMIAQVADANYSAVKESLALNIHLLWQQDLFTDRVGRQFTKLTPLTYILWANDQNMLKTILGVIDEANIAEDDMAQLITNYQDWCANGICYRDPNKHEHQEKVFNIKTLILQLEQQKLLLAKLQDTSRPGNNDEYRSALQQVDLHFTTIIAQEQSRIPVHVFKHMYGEKARPDQQPKLGRYSGYSSKYAHFHVAEIDLDKLRRYDNYNRLEIEEMCKQLVAQVGSNTATVKL